MQFLEPLFRKEMRRDIFCKCSGYEEGLSLARLKFIELVLNYNGADYEHFAGYVKCRIHFPFYDVGRIIAKFYIFCQALFCYNCDAGSYKSNAKTIKPAFPV